MTSMLLLPPPLDNPLVLVEPPVSALLLRVASLLVEVVFAEVVCADKEPCVVAEVSVGATVLVPEVAVLLQERVIGR